MVLRIMDIEKRYCPEQYNGYRNQEVAWRFSCKRNQVGKLKSHNSQKGYIFKIFTKLTLSLKQ